MAREPHVSLPPAIEFRKRKVTLSKAWNARFYPVFLGPGCAILFMNFNSRGKRYALLLLVFSLPICAATRASMAWSRHHYDLDVPVAAQHGDAHVVLVADQQQIDGRPGHCEVVNPQLAQRGRQARAGEADLRFRPADP
jgi:hypothetical protein